MSYCVERQARRCMAYATMCYERLDNSLKICTTEEQPILKNRIFDMLDRVKYLLDKDYPTIEKRNTDNSNFIKGENAMKHEHEKSRRHAENTIAEANRHLDSGKIKRPEHHQMLTAMIKDATETLRNLDDMDNARPYSDTNIGYNTDMARNRYAVDRTMDLVDKILPFLDDMDDDVVDRRGRPRRTRSGVGRWTNVRRHVRRMPRSDMDDRYDDDRYDMDDRYDDLDDRYDDVEDRRRLPRRGRSGRFIRGDMDDMRNDERTIYPGTPVMPRNDHNPRTDDRHMDADRYDDVDDRARRPVPGMRTT